MFYIMHTFCWKLEHLTSLQLKVEYQLNDWPNATLFITLAYYVQIVLVMSSYSVLALNQGLIALGMEKNYYFPP